MFAQILSFDSQILLFIQNFIRNDFLDPVMLFFTYAGEAGTIWIIISIVLIFTKKYRKAGFLTLLCLLICYIANDLIIKNIVMRPRPFETITNLQVLSALPSSWSFPSGHACSSFAAAYAITRGCGKKGAFAYILAALIAFSRSYVGVHYFSDILVGGIVGTVLSAAIYGVLSTLYNKIASKKKVS